MSNKNNQNLSKLLERLPKKYHERVANLETESGLIDDCKYILTFAEGWEDFEGGTTLPCRSINEAIYFIKNEAIKKATSNKPYYFNGVKVRVLHEFTYEGEPYADIEPMEFKMPSLQVKKSKLSEC